MTAAITPRPAAGRRVLVTLDLETALGLDELRNYGAWDQALQGCFFGGDTTVVHIHTRVNPPKQKKAPKRPKKRPMKKPTRLGRKVRRAGAKAKRRR